MSFLTKPFRLLGKAATSIIDVRVDRWLSWPFLKEQSAALYQLTHNLFKVKQPPQSYETFEASCQRLGLTEAQLQERSTYLLRMTYFYLSIAVTLLAYTFYLAFYGAISATIMTLCLTAYACVQAFSQHFWRFQIQQKRLGCTFQEWLAHYVSS